MIRWAMLGVVLGVVLMGCGPRAEKADTARLFPCRRAVGKITIDGKLDEPAWERAYLLDDFRLPVSLERPESATSARVLWDDEYLYFAMVMEDLDVTAVKKEHDSYTWEDDVAELFLKPSDAEHPYYELQVNALNTSLDLNIARRGAGTFDRWKPWVSGIRSAVVVKGTLNHWKDKDKGWMVEAAVPLKSFLGTTRKPQLGDRWRFAFCRYDYSVYLEAKELSSSARLPVGSFHHFEGYDWLEFAE